MGIYIYRESAGLGLVFVESQNVPSQTRTIKTVNGEAIPTGRQNYSLVDTVTAANDAAQWSNKDPKAVSDAIKTIVENLGSGDIETGFNALSESEKYIAAANNVGTPAQIAAYTPPPPPLYTLDVIG